MNTEDEGRNTAPGHGTKRPACPTTGDNTKRRGPYALRACDICRRRKGKCDGGQPCAYCLGRALNCCYAPSTDELRASQMMATAFHEERPQLPRQSTWNLESESVVLGQFMADLQGQINSLAAQVRQSSARSASISSVPSLTSHGDDSSAADYLSSTAFESAHLINRASSPKRKSPGCTSTKGTMHRFYGPTSPEYSLNVAQSRLRRESFAISDNDARKLASTDENQSDNDSPPMVDQDDEDQGETDLTAPFRSPQSRTLRQKLLYFRTILPKREAIRLLFVYQEVIGDLHPVFSIEALVEEVEGWYKLPLNEYGTASNSARNGMDFGDESNLVIANLALTTAICADSTLKPNAEAEIYASCREVVYSMLASPVLSVRNCVVTLLMGIYHWFKDMPQVSWRMCGLAGCMLMELGLHNPDVSEHVLSSEQQREEIVTLTCSLIILDRQWSATTGLPSNFQNSPFESSLLLGKTKTPYLKAMISFILISDKFSEPSSRVATGGSYEDDDDFEIMNFQIEQWRRKTVEKYNLQPSAWQAAPSSRPPWWAIVLYLRANSVRALLLRPFFFPGSPTESSKRSIRPGLDLVSDTINMLSILDRTTDIFRKQHPHFQHLLSSSSALLFLIIAYVAKNRAVLSTCLPKDFGTVVGSNFRKAFALAAAYRHTSRFARKLWNRLLFFMEPLYHMGILSREDMTTEETQHFAPTTVETVVQQVSVTKPSNSARINDHGSSAMNDSTRQPLAPVAYQTGMVDCLPSEAPQGQVTAGWTGAVLYDWPWNETNNFFSDRGL